MSGKRISPLDDPPNVSSSEEEEEEVGSSSSEDEEEVMKKPETALPIMDKQQKEVSDTESATSEYETDSEPEPEKEDPVKKQETKPATETKKKRPMETDREEEEETAKKKAKNVVSGGEEEKKKYFQRVWSEEDEIAVLQGFLDYETKTRKCPFVDTSGFYQLTKNNVSFDVKRIQWNEKVRKLKKKFDTNLVKGRKGQDPTFVKSHDRKVFDLSKLIWGVNGIAPESTFTSTSKKTSAASNSNKKLDLLNTNNNKGELFDPVAKNVLVKSLGMDDLAVQQGWNKLGSEDKKRFEEQWRALQLKEFEFYSQKSRFINQVVTKMAENL